MIIIIGGGLTGLACGHQLAGLGTAHLVVEASDRPGGVIRSGRVRGHLLEWGPQRARLTIGLLELVQELGLEPELITAPVGLPLYILRGGRLRLVPFSIGGYLRSDLLSWRGKLRMLAEPFSRPARDEEDVAGFLQRKIGTEAYENLVGPLYGGLYGSDPADMQVGLSLAHALRELGVERSLLLPLLRRGGRITPPPACTFREGMQMLPRALHERNRSNVRFGCTVRRIRARSGGGYSLELAGEDIEADQIVITTPAPEAAAMLDEIAPLPAEAFRSLTYNALAVVHLHSRTDLVGLGYQVSLAERTVTRGVTFNDSIFGRSGVYTAYLGGSRVPAAVGWSDERLMETAVDEFREATGFTAEPLSVQRERMPAWDRSWSALADVRLPEGIHIAANWESRPGIPGRLLQAKRIAVLLAGLDQARRAVRTKSEGGSRDGDSL